MPETTNVSHDLTIRVPVRAIHDASRRAADAICAVVPADDLHEEYIGFGAVNKVAEAARATG